MAYQTDNRSYPFSYYTHLVRFDKDGFRDYTFAMDSNYEVYLDGFSEDLICLSSGEMLAIYRQNENAELNILPSHNIIKINSDGTLNSSFGDNGIASYYDDYYGSTGESTGLSVLPDGSIIFGTTFYEESNSRFSVCHFTQQGTQIGQPSNYDLGIIGYEFLTSMRIDKQNRVLFASTTYRNDSEDSSDINITRLLPNMQLDNSFNGTGKLTIPLDKEFPSNFLYDMYIHSDSSIYLTGAAEKLEDEQDLPPGEKYTSFILRVDNSGKVDSSIAVNGTPYFYQRSEVFEDIYAITSANDGSILFAGDISNSSFNSTSSISKIKRIPGRMYKFLGSGNWNNPANWSYGMLPPAVLPAGSVIIISPNNGQPCILNVPQHISHGATITVLTGANLIITGSLVFD